MIPDQQHATLCATVTRIALNAKATLPQESHSRLARATEMVLNGAVHIEEDGRTCLVRSSCGTHWYPVNGACSCPDYARAPGHYCKHRLARALYLRARRALQAAPGAGTAGVTRHPLAPVFAGSEAPASANVYLLIEGRQVQLTLRDTDETHLLARLTQVLRAYPQTPQR